MAFTENDVPDQSGKTVLITGGNSGIGFEAARVFAHHNADVLLACRNAERGHEAQARILAQAPHARVEVSVLDLASLASIREFAGRTLATRARLHALINNAGVMAIPRQLTHDGFELQLGVNHFGHFALTGLLLPLLLATDAARIVTVSSRASSVGRIHFDDLHGARSYHKWVAYAQSKLANLLFSFELARRFEAKALAARSIACHPGYATTNLHMLGPQLTGSRAELWIMDSANRLFGQSARGGALPTLFAATAPAAHNGEFIGPQGLFGRAGAPGTLRATSAAYDAETLRKLWAISIELTRVTYAELD